MYLSFAGLRNCCTGWWLGKSKLNKYMTQIIISNNKYFVVAVIGMLNGVASCQVRRHVETTCSNIASGGLVFSSAGPSVSSTDHPYKFCLLIVPLVCLGCYLVGEIFSGRFHSSHMCNVEGVSLPIMPCYGSVMV